MWSVGSLEPPILTGSHYMSTLSPTSGLFDNDGLSPEPTDLLDFDPDLLSTLKSPPGSVESRDSAGDDMIMMENWQMNEVFQDIPDQDDNSTASSPLCNETDDDLDTFVKHVLGNDIPAKSDIITIDLNTLESSGIVDLSTENIIPVELDLETVVKEAFGSEGLQGYDLLDELEAMDCAVATSPAVTNKPAENSGSVAESDHQYTQLSKIQVKPHETKKQAIRRVKNNAASKVCRKQRKTKFALNQMKIDELTKANCELRTNIDNVQTVVDLLKVHLVKATCKK